MKKMQSRVHKNVFRLIVSISSLFVLMFFGCSSSKEITSGWTNQELAITGDGSRWKDVSTEIAGPDVSVGVKNDNNNLYIGLVTSNRATQLQILGLGCTAWFDTEGKKNKTFGIQFPVPGLLQGRRFPTRENPEEFQRLINAAQRQLIVLGPGVGEQHRMSVQESRGIEARIGYVDGTMTYELKVPLQKSKDQPYAVNVDLATPVFIGFETGDLAEAMKGQPGVSSPSQNAGGGRGRGAGRTGPGGGPGGVGNEMPEPLKHWITVHLSSGATAK
jgi:hypothetical protein